MEHFIPPRGWQFSLYRLINHSETEKAHHKEQEILSIALAIYQENKLILILSIVCLIVISEGCCQGSATW